MTLLGWWGSEEFEEHGWEDGKAPKAPKASSTLLEEGSYYKKLKGGEKSMTRRRKMSKAQRDKWTFRLVSILTIAVVFGIFMGGYVLLKGSVTEPAAPGAGGTGAVGGGEKVRTGVTASLTIKPIDIAGDSKSTKTDVNISVYEVDDPQSPIVSYNEYSATADGAVTSVVTGKSYMIYAIDSSYVFMEDDVVTKPIEVTQERAEVYVHTRVAENNMDFKCYDSENNELAAASDTTKADYNLTIGAGETKKIYCKLRVAAANKATALGGVAVLYQNDIKKVTLTSVTVESVKPTNQRLVDRPYYLSSGKSFNFAKGSVPEHMKSLTFASSLIKGDSWSNIYLLEEPPVLVEWEELRFDFTVEAKEGSDPTFSTSSSTADVFCILVKDWAPYESTDRSVKWGIADDTSNEADVGLDETDNSPEGKQVGACIQGI